MITVYKSPELKGRRRVSYIKNHHKRQTRITKQKNYREWYAKNRLKICAYMRQYRNKNKNNERYRAMRKAQERRYQIKYKAEIKLKRRHWYQAIGKNYQRKYVERNREKINAQTRIWRATNKERYLRVKKEWKEKNLAKYRFNEIVRSRIYNSRPETKEKRHRYDRKRSWIIQRLVLMAHDDGTYKLLRENMWELTRYEANVQIRIRLIAMANEDGTYQLLAKEYDNGERSVRQTDARPDYGKEHRRELQVS